MWWMLFPLLLALAPDRTRARSAPARVEPIYRHVEIELNGRVQTVPIRNRSSVGRGFSRIEMYVLGSWVPAQVHDSYLRP